jgi:hypothetical protein
VNAEKMLTCGKSAQHGSSVHRAKPIGIECLRMLTILPLFQDFDGRSRIAGVRTEEVQKDPRGCSVCGRKSVLYVVEVRSCVLANGVRR